MKHILLLPLLALACNTLFSQHPILYLNFVSHNEPGDSLQFFDKFTRSRDRVMEMGALMETKQASWNLQTCDGFVNGSLNFDTFPSNVFSQLLLGTASDYIQIDPRNKNLTNIADLYHLLDSANANPSHTLGGFIWYSTVPAMPPDWFQYQDTITGITYPSVKWKAELMWGAGSIPPHTNDYNDWGIWKPDTVDQFGTHNPGRNVWFIGSGCQPIFALDSLEDENILIDLIQGVVDSLQNDLLPQDKFYHLSITLNQSQFGPMLLGKVSNLIDSVNALGPKIAWRTLKQTYKAFGTWMASHDDHSQWLCGETFTSAEPAIETSVFAVSPNPFQSTLSLRALDGRTHQVRVTNALGQVFCEAQLSGALEISSENWPAGLYLVWCDNGSPTKVVRQ